MIADFVPNDNVNQKGYKGIDKLVSPHYNDHEYL